MEYRLETSVVTRIGANTTPTNQKKKREDTDSQKFFLTRNLDQTIIEKVSQQHPTTQKHWRPSEMMLTQYIANLTVAL